MTGQATAEMITALLATVGEHQQAREALNATRAARIARYIDEHLGDADLTTGQIAVAHRMSARQLTAAWRRAHDATPAGWIAQRRLERSWQMLTDPALAPATIDEIAYACGFSDPADFSQRFRARYGTAPRDCRLPRLGHRRREWDERPRC